MGQKGATIEPDKYIVEDIEVLGFETEKDLNFYTLWQESLMDKRRELAAKSDRERDIIKNEIARKTKQLIRLVGDETTKTTSNKNSSSKSAKSSSKRSTAKRPSATNRQQLDRPSTPKPPAPQTETLTTPSSKTPAAIASRATSILASPSRSSSKSSPNSAAALVALLAANRQRQGAVSIPNNLEIIGETNYHKKFKITKLYNKYRGRQQRRNFVRDKQSKTRIDIEVSNSYLNSWLAYTALQALRLPESCQTTGTSTTTSNGSKFRLLTSANPQVPNTAPNMHLVYLDPGELITYSNKINPYQVREYKRKSHLLPLTACSKKSSAASYDVYEIMEVLANTNKTNVTITRNANRPSQSGNNSGSIYSHSVNTNTPGIVSTQLHLQAKFHLDMLSKFYAEEHERLEKEAEQLKQAPSDEEVIAKYIKI